MAALVQFGNGRMELLSHGVPCIGNFFPNAYQYVCATFSQTQRREAIRLDEMWVKILTVV